MHGMVRESFLLETIMFKNSAEKIWDITVGILEQCRFRRSERVAQSQPAISCSKVTIETLEQGVKYVQSEQ